MKRKTTRAPWWIVMVSCLAAGCIYPRLEVDDSPDAYDVQLNPRDASAPSDAKAYADHLLSSDGGSSDVSLSADTNSSSHPDGFDALPDPVSVVDTGADSLPTQLPVDAGPACTADQKLCGGSCVARSDPTFGCGAATCDSLACPDPGSGTLVCQGSLCAIGNCGLGSKKCGTKCVDVSDPNYGCGPATCDKTTCPNLGAGGTLACSAGVCVIGTCPSGTKKCGDKCVAVNDPTYGCGATTCDKSACPQPGTATLACSGNTCVIGTCGSGTKKCAGRCVSVADPSFGCGATTCDETSCPNAAGGTLVCQAGACVIGTCGPGTKACGSKCVPTDANNGCAAAGVCTACAANQTCVGSPSTCTCIPDNAEACKNKACGTAVNNCGQTVQCTNTCTSPNTCGGGGAGPNACGCTPNNTTCNGVACGSVKNNCGTTVSCPDTCPAQGKACGAGGVGSNACGCVPSMTHCTSSIQCGTVPDGCGGTIGCGKSCPANPAGASYSCVANACVFTCNSGTNCSGTCINTSSDPAHCGSCTKVCPDPGNGVAACSASACVPKCNDGQPPCGGTTCCAAPQPNYRACTSNVCNPSIIHPVTCSDGAQVVGSWSFESNTNEHWGREFFAQSVASVSSAHPRGSSKFALKGAIDAPFGDAADASGDLVVSPCVGTINMQGRTLSAWVYFEASVTYSLVEVAGVAGDVNFTAGTAPTTDFVSFSPAMYNQWRQISFTFNSSDSRFTAVGDVGIHFETSGVATRANFYVDDVVIDPPL